MCTDAAGDKAQIAETLGDLSDVYSDERDYSAATACLGRAIALAERFDLPRILGWTCQMQAAIAQLNGRPARALIQESLTAYQSINDQHGIDDATSRLAPSTRA
jgi:hypothetical protein